MNFKQCLVAVALLLAACSKTAPAPVGSGLSEDPVFSLGWTLSWHRLSDSASLLGTAGYDVSTIRYARIDDSGRAGTWYAPDPERNNTSFTLNGIIISGYGKAPDALIAQPLRRKWAIEHLHHPTDTLLVFKKTGDSLLHCLYNGASLGTENVAIQGANARVRIHIYKE